jgi:predicted nucleotidyltransferase component of viral defense system
MDSNYIDTVRLLLAVTPDVFRGDEFAMKGGTALNLFVHDMPRLSVDIDLVYTSWSEPRVEALEAIGHELSEIARRLGSLGVSVRSVSAMGADASKLVIERRGIQVKLEANMVFRGTVLPVEHRDLVPTAAEMFSAELAVPTLAIDEMYGSKIVAALDRQHPRDFFDIDKMYETHGLTDAAIECFVLYLAGHNRPMHEVLDPHRKDIMPEFKSSFSGMTREPVDIATLDAARERLLQDLPDRLTSDQRAFLVGLAKGEPDWSLVECHHARELPAIRWRLQNLIDFQKRRPNEFARQVDALRKVLAT